MSNNICEITRANTSRRRTYVHSLHWNGSLSGLVDNQSTKKEKDDKSAALTPANFLTGTKLTTIPSRLENKRQSNLQAAAGTYRHFLEKWPKNVLNCYSSIKFEIRTWITKINIRVADIVLLQERCPTTEHVEETKVMSLH
ncbi:hypothetical protein TNCV_2844451 [Trichonephila clavipes]|nr:hypothetical protein TNCV_2844451 [Trichonephila clavipes]